MPCKQLGCESIEELLSLIESQCKGARNIFVLCTGAEDTTTGKSWCSDCVKGIMFYFFHYYLFNKETYLLCIRELIFPTRQSRVECIERSPVPFCLQLSSLLFVRFASLEKTLTTSDISSMGYNLAFFIFCPQLLRRLTFSEKEKYTGILATQNLAK